MANPRAQFNEMVQIGDFNQQDYPEVRFTDGSWFATKRYRGKYFCSVQQTKAKAIDQVLSEMFDFRKSLNQHVNSVEPMEIDYCCSKQCFCVPDIQVDGVACNICRAFSYCKCNCKSYKIDYKSILYAMHGSYTVKHSQFIGKFYTVEVIAPYETSNTSGNFTLKSISSAIASRGFDLDEFVDQCIKEFLDHLP